MTMPTGAESREAIRLGRERGHAWFLNCAALRIRCVTCSGGPVIAVIAYVDGRPLAALHEQNDRLAPDREPIGRHWQYQWGDRGPFLNVRCRSTWHVLEVADLVVPPPGAHRGADVRLTHADTR